MVMVGMGLSVGSMRSMSSPVARMASVPSIVWYHPLDHASISVDGDGSTPPGIVNDLVGRVDDRSGNSRHLIAPAKNNRPRLREDGIEYIAGNKLAIDLTGASGRSDVFIKIIMKSSHYRGATLTSSTPTSAIGPWWQGGSGAAVVGANFGTPTIKVDGAVVSTAGALHTAIADGDWHIVDMDGSDVSDPLWDTMSVSGYGGAFDLVGYHGAFWMGATANHAAYQHIIDPYFNYVQAEMS